MTDNGPAETPAGPHPYFMAIEDVFLDLRGSPLQLSNADWQLAEKWFGEGIPLELVERTVRAAFARRESREGNGKKTKVWSLRYCKRSVEAAWKRQQELMASGTPDTTEEALDLTARLRRLAAALPASVVDRETVTQEIMALTGEAEGIEEALAAMDREVLAAMRSSLDTEQQAEIERELALSRQALSRRLPATEVERSMDALQDQILRRLLGLPVLSLFAPEAMGSPDA